jgi:hypothetical protein
MSDLHNFLGPLRPEVLLINENQEAMSLALLFGVADQLSDPGTPGPCGKYVSYEVHPTHWVICYRSWRNTEPKDNGWSVWFFPKATLTLQQVFERLKKLGGSAPLPVKRSAGDMS